MKQFARKFLALLMAVLMFVTCVPTSGLAALTVASSSVSVRSIVKGINPPQGDVYVQFEFYNGTELVRTQIVNQTAGGELIAPPTPEVPMGKKFDGWYIGDNAVQFGTVTGYTANTTVQVNARFSDVFYVYFMTVEENGTRSVFATKEATADNNYKVTPPTNYEPKNARVIRWYTEDNATFNENTAITEDTRVYPETVDCFWISFDPMGGSGVESIYADAGVNKSLSGKTSTRTGYTFAGWSTTSDGNNVINSITPTDDILLYAKWNPAPVNYTVVYWGENANNSDYVVINTAVKQANTGTVLTLNASTGALPNNTDNRSYYDFNHSETVTIQADGSSVLNAYYNRKTYTFTFQRRYRNNTWQDGDGTRGTWTTIHTFSAKVGASIASDFTFRGSDNTNYPANGVSWMPYNSTVLRTRIAVLDIMPAANITFRHETAGSSYNHHFYYYGEALPGQTGTRTYNGKQYVLIYDLLNDFRQITDEEKLTLVGFTFQNAANANNGNVSIPSNVSNVDYYLYYTRGSYNFKLNNYGSIQTTSYYYEQPLTAPATPARPEGFSENAQFMGWYEVEPAAISDTTPVYNFTGKTMPANDLVLYAYWKEPTISFSIELNIEVEDGSFVAAPVMIPAGTLISETALFKSATQWVNEHNLVILKWVDANTSALVNVYEPLFENKTITAVFQGLTYTVSYNAGAGSGADITDTYSYANGALAKARECSFTAPEKKVFTHWVDANGNKYYPGQDITVVASNIVLTAVYADLEDTAQVVYHDNLNPDRTKTTEAVLNNSEITLLSYNETGFTAPTGFEFVEWNTQSNGGGASFAAGATARVDNNNEENHLYAIWEPIPYNVIYNIEGTAPAGAPAAPETVFGITIGTMVNVAAPLTFEGWVFDGWNNAQGVQVTNGRFAMPAHDVVFTGSWIRNSYEVKYQYVGEVPAGATDISNYNHTGIVGTTYNVKPAATAAGYTFSGWSTSNANVSNGSFEMPDNEVVFTGRFYKNVTVTANSATETFDNTLKSVSDYTGAPSDAQFSITVGASGTNVGEYDATFPNGTVGMIDTTGKYIIKEAINGKLTINPATVTVTIKGNTDTKVYNGNAHTVTGYEVVNISNSLYTAADFSLVEGAAATASQTNVGTAYMGLTENSFKNNNNNFDVNFVVTDGYMAVTKLDVTITITGNNDTQTYDGEAHTVNGYTMSATSPLYSEDYLSFDGTATATQTNVGTANMGLAESQFENTSLNFNVVDIVVNDGYMTITPRDITVTITGNTKTETYNGNAQTVTGYTAACEDDLYDATKITFSGDATATRTEVGTTYMGLDEDEFGYTDTNLNVTFAVTDGWIEIEKLAVTVTIKANSDSVVYNGKTQSATGFTFVSSDPLYTAEHFEAINSVKVEGKDVGVYNGTITADDFRNNDPENFTVTFVVADKGKLTITERPVKFRAVSETYTYNGNEHTATEYTIDASTADSGLAEGHTATAVPLTGNKRTKVGEQAIGVDTDNVVISDGSADVTSNYTITYVPATLTVKGTVSYNGNGNTAGAAPVDSNTYALNASVPVATSGNLVKQGYVFFGWTRTAMSTMTLIEAQNLGSAVYKPGSTIPMDEDNISGTGTTFFALWVTTDGTPYKVYHYTESLEGVYEYFDTDSLSGETDAAADYTPRTIDGFTYESSLKEYKKSGMSDFATFTTAPTIASDGSLEIKLYYSRRDDLSYTVNYYWNGTTVSVADSKTVNGRTFGATYTEYPITIEGCTAVSLDSKSVEIALTGNVINFYYYKNVAITANGDPNVTYNGAEHSVSGYTGAPADAEFEITVGAKGTDVGTYPAKFAEGTVDTVDKTEKYIIKEATDSELVISKLAVTVGVTGNKTEETYDGQLHKAEGYVLNISDPLYNASYFTFSGTSTVQTTDVATIYMQLAEEQFVNTNDNFDVTFEIVSDGYVKVNPLDVTVTINGKKTEETYDGTEYNAKGYTFAANSTLFTENDFTFSGNDFVRRTIYGKTAMGLHKSHFAGANGNFNPTFVVESDGYVKINKREITVTIVGDTKTYTYNGANQKAEGYVPATTDTLYDLSKVTFSGTDFVERKDVGKTDMGLKAAQFDNTDSNFIVKFDVTDGWVEITQLKVKVDITGNTGTKVYDGAAMKITGFDIAADSELYLDEYVQFTGTDEVERTDVGKDFMGLKAEQFSNKNGNFDVEFNVVSDGYVEITKLAITVEIEGATDTKEYNGAEQKVENYFINNLGSDLYSPDDFTFSGTAEAKRINVGTTNMGLKKTDFTNNNGNFDVEFEVVDGWLTIEKCPVTVTITGNTDTYTFNGAEQKVEGFESVEFSNTLFTAADYEFKKDEAVAKRTNIGTTEMGLTENDFASKNDNFEVTFVVVDGSVTIEKLPVTVKINGNKVEEIYDATEYTAAGYAFNPSNTLYTTNDFTFSGTESVSRTNVGQTNMNLAAGQFKNDNDNFEVEFVVETDGYVKITERTATVLIVGNTATKIFNGSAQKVENYTYAINDPLYKVTDFAFNGTAKAERKDVGTTNMGLAESQFVNNNTNFVVKFNVTDGWIKINPLKVTITITGDTETAVYDGDLHEADGFTYTTDIEIPQLHYSAADYEFSGTDHVELTDVGTENMNIAPEQFENINPNFDPTFVVEQDGYVTVTPLAVTVEIKGNNDTFTYDGNEHKVEGYVVTISDELYTEADFTFSGTDEAVQTDVGTKMMGLAEEQFKNDNNNFTVTFTVTEDGFAKVLGFVTYDGNEQTEGTAPVDNNKYELGANVSIADRGSLAKTGYQFYGWTRTQHDTMSKADADALNETIYNAGDTIAMNGGNISGTSTTFYALWVAKEGTEYIVNHYTEKLDEGWDLLRKDELSGATDAVATFTTLTPDGFTYDASLNTYKTSAMSEAATFTTNPTIAPDGSLVINLYYTRRDDLTYTVNYYWNGTTEKVADTKTVEDVTFGATYSESPITIEGCTAVSADEKSIVIAVSGNVIDFYYYKNVELTANSGEFEYDGEAHSVEGYTKTFEAAVFDFVVSESKVDVGEYAVKLPESAVGTVDNTAKYIVTKATDGVLEITALAITVEITGNNDTFIYDGVEHVVEGYTVEISNDLYKEDYITYSGDAAAARTFVETTYMELAEADFDNDNGNFDVTFEVVEDGYVTIEKRSVTFKVTEATYTFDNNEHSTVYTVVPADEETGLPAGHTQTAVLVNNARTKVGSHEVSFDETKTVISFNGADVTANFNIAYIPANLTVVGFVTYDGNGNTEGTAPVDSNTYELNEAVTVLAKGDLAKTGYTFSGWTLTKHDTMTKADAEALTETVYNSGDTIAMNEDNISLLEKTFFALWTTKEGTEYIVNHYIENVEKNGYTLYDTDSLDGVTDAVAAYSPKTLTGFTYDASKNTYQISGMAAAAAFTTENAPTIAPDGSLIINLYYTRNVYTFTFRDGYSAEGSDVVAKAELPFEAETAEFTGSVEEPTREDYVFAGWDNPNYPETMPAEDVDITATWMGLSIEKTITNAAGKFNPGDAVYYSVVVKNLEGSAGALDIVLSDTLVANDAIDGGEYDPDGFTLEVGESATFTYKYVITAYEVLDEYVENTAIVESTFTRTDGETDVVTERDGVKAYTKDNENPKIVSKTNMTVDEDGLANGSNGNSARTVATGKVIVDFNNEGGTVEIGEIEIEIAFDGSLIAQSKESFSTGKGVFKVTDVAVNDHGQTVVSYEYTLSANQAHAAANGENTLTDTISFKAVDGTDDEVNGTVNVTIVDDVPSIEIAAEATGAYNDDITGKTAIVFGADGEKNVAATVNGVAGTGTRGTADYTYTFTDGTTLVLNMTTGAFTYSGIPVSGEGTEYEFVFTVTDGDDDTDTATTTAEIEPTDYSEYAGSVESSDIDVVTSGVEHEVTFEEVPLGANLVPNKTYTGTYGTIVVDENGKAMYTQTGVYYHDKATADTLKEGAEVIAVKATLDDGFEITVNVTVDINDDVPAAAIVIEASGEYNADITGRMAVDFGADGHAKVYATVNGMEAVVTTTADAYTFTYADSTVLTYSLLTGDFVYSGIPASGDGATYTFVFTVTDVDGDTATVTTVAEIEATDFTAYKGAVESKDSEILTAAVEAHTVEFQNTPEGAKLVEGIYEGTYGDITVDAEGKATYVQNSAYDHDKATADTRKNGAETITLNAKLGDGTEITVDVRVDIVDDVPAIAIATEAAGAYNTDIEGAVNIAFGADGEQNVAVTVNDMNGTGTRETDGYAYTFTDGTTLALDMATGEFVYSGIPTSGNGATYKFVFTVTDGDDDTATAETTAEIVPTDYSDYKGSVVSSDADILKADVQTHAVTFDNIPVGAELVPNRTYTDATYGDIIVDANGVATYYVQKLAYSHDKETCDERKNGAEVITLDATLDDGTPITVDVTVDIIDDVPTVAVDTEATGAYGQPINGSFDINYGADGESATAVQVNLNAATSAAYSAGSYTFVYSDGTTLVLNVASGDFTYTGIPTSGGGATYEFEIIITDGDFDTAAATTTATIEATDYTAYAGSVVSGDSETLTDAVEAHAVEFEGVPAGAKLVPSKAYTGTYGDITVDENGAATYVQKLAYSHDKATADTRKDGAETITIDATLDDGFEITVDVTVDIKDDVPSIAIATEATGEYNSDITGKVAIDFGADGEKNVAVTVNGMVGTGTRGTDGYAFTFTDGTTLALDMTDGTFAYSGIPASGDGATYEFVFTVTDGDDDTDTATTTAEIEATDFSTYKGSVTSNDSDILSASAIAHTVDFVNTPDGATLVDGTYTGTYGDITVEEGEANYVQKLAYSHDKATADEIKNGAETITLNAKLGDGSAITVNVTVNITDDNPVIAIATEATGEYNSTITGKVDIAFGADDEKNVEVTVNDMVGTGTRETDGYAYTFTDGTTLTLDMATGEFVYSGIPTSGNGATYTFVFTVTDGDDDTDTATTTAEIAPTDYSDYKGSVVSNDADILEETVQTHEVTFVGIPVGSELVKNKTYNGTYGDIVVDENGIATYYVQKIAYSHDKATCDERKDGAEVITLDALFNDGTALTVDVTVDIIDDTPAAENDTAELTEDTATAITGDVLTNDSFGADDKAEEYVVWLETDAAVYGTITRNSDGTYEYLLDVTLEEVQKLNEGDTLTETFNYTIVDGDGDTATAALTITITGVNDLLDLTVVKVWNDSDNNDGKRPDSITVSLLVNGNEDADKRVTLTSGEDGIWQENELIYTWTGLRVHDEDGNKYEYTFAEEAIDEYTNEFDPIAIIGNSTDGTDEQTVTLTNTHETELMLVTVVKVWDDTDNQDGARPNAVALTLMSKVGEDEAQPVEGAAAGKLESPTGEWTEAELTYTWEGLPVYLNGERIAYSVVETTIDGYDMESVEYEESYDKEFVTGDDDFEGGVEDEDVITITNTYHPKFINIAIEKVWDDGDNRDAIRPDSIELTLYGAREGEETETIETFTLSKSGDGWLWNDEDCKYAINDLPAYKDGKKYTYTLVENTVIDGYETEYVGNDIQGNIRDEENVLISDFNIVVTNRHEPETFEISITKHWNDNKNAAGKRPKQIAMLVYADGELYSDRLYTFADGQTYTMTAFRYERGVEINYTLTEGLLSDYLSYITKKVEGNLIKFDVTNTYDPAEVKVLVYKNWVDMYNKPTEPAGPVEFTLYCNYEEIGKGVLENGTFYAFENLEKYNSRGIQNRYQVRETSKPEGTRQIEYTMEFDRTNDIWTATFTNRCDDATTTIIEDRVPLAGISCGNIGDCPE